MTPRHRGRRTFKWLLSAAWLVTLAVGVEGSLWPCRWRHPSGIQVDLWGERVCIEWDSPRGPSGLGWRRVSVPAVRDGVGLPRWQLRAQPQFVLLPLWIPLVLLACPAVWLWWLDARPRPLECRRCRYSLRGLPHAPDPQHRVGWVIR